jgi:hypothetical protein
MPQPCPNPLNTVNDVRSTHPRSSLKSMMSKREDFVYDDKFDALIYWTCLSRYLSFTEPVGLKYTCFHSACPIDCSSRCKCGCTRARRHYIHQPSDSRATLAAKSLDVALMSNRRSHDDYRSHVSNLVRVFSINLIKIASVCRFTFGDLQNGARPWSMSIT